MITDHETDTGDALEVIGYGARIMIHNNPFDSNAFIVLVIYLIVYPLARANE